VYDLHLFLCQPNLAVQRVVNDMRGVEFPHLILRSCERARASLGKKTKLSKEPPAPSLIPFLR
ncbi:hypothetical protein KBC59_02175, partial [Patescibacteria group bacterium]|nr:hypothetical protein [Patescibacteria group bacterium]